VGEPTIPISYTRTWGPIWLLRSKSTMLAGMGDAGDDGVLWTAVDAYLADHLIAKDDVLEAALRDSEAAELPPIQVTALQGKMLQMFARMVGARRILEVGTLGGYSTIWLARALPECGRLVTLEAAAKHAAVARRNLERAGLMGIDGAPVELREGPALETLPQLVAEGVGPFDLIFLDADKEHNAEYLQWAIRLSREGTVIVADNVVREGTVLNAASEDAVVRGTRRFFEAVAAESRVSATAIQTVSGKKYDGFALLIVD
jgi:predicted O-methyltransferase YrrM